MVDPTPLRGGARRHSAKSSRDRRLGSTTGPVVIQRRAQAARQARASATLLRVAVLIATDVLAVSLAFGLAEVLLGRLDLDRQLGGFLVAMFQGTSRPRIEVLCAIVLGLALVRNYGAGPYRQSAGRLFSGLTLGLSFVFWSRIWDGVTWPGALGFVVAVLSIGTFLVLGRVSVQYFVNAVRPTPWASSRAIVVGSRERARELMSAEYLRLHSRLLLVGYLGSQHADEPDCLGTVNELVQVLDRYAIDTVMIADGLEPQALLEVLDVCDRTGCTALSVSTVFPAAGFVPRVTTRGPIPYVELVRPSLRAPQLAIKRLFDIVVSSLLLVILSPFLALVAFGVRLGSRGPVIYAHERVGYAGKIFQMYKFRTMIDNAEDLKSSLQSESLYKDERVFKIRNDPRVTRFGRLLRRTSIDELPQLWNVIRGEMSLVGPRPPLPNEVAQYEEQHYRRFDMKPGITGPWQVAGRNEVTCFEEILALDAAYLTDWTIGKDFVLLLRTIPAVASMRGAM